MSKLLKNTGKLVIFIAAYYVFLYIFLLNFSLESKYYSAPKYDLIRFTCGLLFSILGVALLDLKKGEIIKLSTLFFIFQLYLVYIPANLFISLHSEYSFIISIFLIICLYFIYIVTKLQTNFLKIAIKKRIALDIKFIVGSPFLIWFSFCIIIFFMLVFRKGISFSTVFDVYQIYTFRSEVFHQYTTIQFIAFYSLAYFLFPLILLYSVNYKNKFLFSIILIANLFLYTLTGMKTYFIIPFFTLFFSWLIKGRNTNSLSTLTIFTIIGICCLTYAVGLYIDSPYPTAFFLRAVIEPAKMHIVWFDFFYDKDKIPFWILNARSHPNFPGLSWEEIIARNLGSTIGNGEGANVGFIANSYSVYGFSGLVIYSFILSAILGFLNFIYELPHNGWVATASIPSIFLLTNISLESSLIYFGLGFSVIASFCLVDFLPKYNRIIS